MNTEPMNGVYSVPIRRTRWLSFWIGMAANIISLLLAIAFSGLLILLSIKVSGAVIIMIFGFLWGGLFFGSYRLQRHYSRSFDLRRPGIRLANGILTVPVTDDFTLQFNLDEPYECGFGWFEVIVSSGGGPTTNTRAVLTYAMLRQAERQVLLIAEESIREAQAAGWPSSAEAPQTKPAVQLWASDIVALVEAIRKRPIPTVPEPEHRPAAAAEPVIPEPVAPVPAAPVPVRDWPGNPLQARNRHEALLYLERQKAEVISRSAIEGGEVILGRTPESSADANPYLYRFVFALLESDPEDKNDFGSGVSRILDVIDLMLEVERLERDRRFGTHYKDLNRADIALTYKPALEIAALRRMNERGIALIDQAMRFAQADGWPSEESFRTYTARKWFQLHRERYHISTLSARQQALRENLTFFELPDTNLSEAQRQVVLVEALRVRCPDYLVELQLAGYEREQILHSKFMHRYHLARFAARALQQGKVEQAHAAFAAWMIAQSNDLYFPTKEFAEAIYELKVDSAIAASLVPERQRNYFGMCYQTEVDPGYNYQGY